MERETRLQARVPWVGLILALALVGCPGSEADDDVSDDDDAGDDDVSGDDDSAGDDDTTSDDDATGDDDTTASASCPPDMVLVDHEAARFCIDRWEARCDEIQDDGTLFPWSPYHAVEGVVVAAAAEDGATPQAYISGEQAAEACLNGGKRLCESDEWLLACRGPDEQIWPYGDTWVPGECNDDYDGHPVIDYYGTDESWIWGYSEMNDPGINLQAGTLAPSGSHAGCVSAFGVYDLVGNLHEWVADAGGTFRGGYYVDVNLNGPGCTYVTTAHDPVYHDYSTGFRCCADAED